MNTFFEILKYILPSLVVFATAYYIAKKFFDAKYNSEVLEYNKTIHDQKFPLKLQAYERLILFCERIDVNNLMLRLINSEIKGNQLAHAMLIAIQKEYEHNIAQQLYVSDNLWKIVNQAKDNILNLVSAHTNTGGTAQEVAREIRNNSAEVSQSLEIAKAAIKEELRTLM